MSEWIRIKSWHAVRTWTRVPGRAVTLCGRVATGESRPTLPMNEAGCETCDRLLIRRLEAKP